MYGEELALQGGDGDGGDVVFVGVLNGVVEGFCEGEVAGGRRFDLAAASVVVVRLRRDIAGERKRRAGFAWVVVVRGGQLATL